MQVKTFDYSSDGKKWEKVEYYTEVNPNEFQLHDIPGLPGVIVGIRVEEDGRVVVGPPEPPKAAV